MPTFLGQTSGGKFTREYATWRYMKARCHQPNHPDYPRWGGRGITVCQRWRDSYAAFLKDMGPRPADKSSLDRIDNEGNYEPGNCRWATAKEQAEHRRPCWLKRKQTRFYEIDGERLTLSDLARRNGLSVQTLHSRLSRYGWSLTEALTTPKHTKLNLTR